MLDGFWYWCKERHSIYEKRKRGDAPPWSSDPVFQRFRFTNVFRDLDRGTRWFILRIAQRRMSMAEYVMNVMVYRIFNSIDTATFLNLPWARRFNDLQWERLRHAWIADNFKAFTGAHMSTKIGFDGVYRVWPKLDFAGLANEIYEGRTVENAYWTFMRVHGLGTFLAHQFAQDLRHTPVLCNAPDGATWSVAGPGAMRGLRLLGLPESPMSKSLKSMQLLASMAPMPMEVKDIQQSLCEYQKYVRLKRMLEEGVRCKARVFDSHERELL